MNMTEINQLKLEICQLFPGDIVTCEDSADMLVVHVDPVGCRQRRQTMAMMSDQLETLTTKEALLEQLKTSYERANRLGKADYAWALNEWWRRYREEPSKFEAEFRTIAELSAADAEGREPTMGHNGWAYMRKLLAERDSAKAG